MISFHNRYKNIKCVKKLLENEANNHTGDVCAIGWSSENGNIDIVKFLFEYGANIHADDCALQWASSKGHIEVVKFLVEKGAEIYKHC